MARSFYNVDLSKKIYASLPCIRELLESFAMTADEANLSTSA